MCETSTSIASWVRTLTVAEQRCHGSLVLASGDRSGPARRSGREVKISDSESDPRGRRLSESNRGACQACHVHVSCDMTIVDPRLEICME